MILMKRNIIYTFREGIKIRSDLLLEEDLPAAVVILAWVHKDFIIKKLKNYISKGGKVISIFPTLEIYSINGKETLDNN